MTSISDQTRLADVLGYMRKKGVRLWAAHGQLHYQAPKGVLTQHEIERLRASKDELVGFLESATGGDAFEPRLERPVSLDRIPLTFSQTAYWKYYRLHERPSIRVVAAATRLSGCLNVDALRRGLGEVVRRHDALRTRIVLVKGTPLQEIAEPGTCEIEMDDLELAPDESRGFEVQRQIERLIMEPVDVAVGPMYRVRLLRFGRDHHVLLAALEHMVSDGASLNIFLQDLFAAYTQVCTGGAIALPQVQMQFSDYAIWQSNAGGSWVDERWRQRLCETAPARFPCDTSQHPATRFWWGAVPLRIGRDVKTELRAWCRRNRTTVVMGVFAAYAALVLRWCGVVGHDSVLHYQTNGRLSPKIQNTIGHFTSALYLRLGLREDDTFFDVLNRVTQEYCWAAERADLGFLAAQASPPQFTQAPVFNWSPLGSDIHLASPGDQHGCITYSPVRFAFPVLSNLGVDGEPAVQLRDAGDEIIGDVHFPMSRFTIETMGKFGRNLLAFIHALLKSPEMRVRDVSISD